MVLPTIFSIIKIFVLGMLKNSTLGIYISPLYLRLIIAIVALSNTDIEIHHIVNHSDSQLLFVSDQIFDQIDELRMHKLKAVLALSDFHLCHCRTPEAREIVEKSATGYVETYHAILSRRDLIFPEVPNEALCAICYTSGTTGFSKGVMLPHNSLVANVRFFIDNLDLTANNRVVSGDKLAIIGDGGYGHGARARQIRDDLLALDQADEQDMLAVQLDNRALFLQWWRDLLLDLLTPSATAAHPERAEFKKFCRRCNSHTAHKETR